MARPKSFQEDKVLDAAIDCFWRNGLKSASIRDLIEEMGIAGPSLYNAYGCKRDLFVQAIERYANQRLRTRIKRLESDYPPKEAILAFFSETVEQASCAPDDPGCLIVNTAMEVPPGDTELSGIIAGYLDEIRAFLLRAVKAGQEAGTISRQFEPGDAAQMLTALFLGLRVLVRTNQDRTLLESAMRPALELLTTPST